MNLVEKNGKLSQEHEISHKDWYSEVQFRPVHDLNNDDSGVMPPPPPLWKNNSPSPARSPSRPLLSHRGNGSSYRSMSPDSRAKAIARGQSELMEMVRRMPEWNYELSLKDIVEHHDGGDQNHAGKTGDGSEQRGVPVKVKKVEKKRIDRNLSFENKGMFLNMVFPFSFNSKKKIKNGGRVSPKPEGLKVGGERDWWKKKFTGSSDSESSRTSDNSATTVSSGATGTSGGDQLRRRRHGLMTGCFQIFRCRGRSKSAE